MLLLWLLGGCRLSQGAPSEGLQGEEAGGSSPESLHCGQTASWQTQHGLPAETNACCNISTAASGTGWLTSIMCMSAGCEAASCGDGCRQRSSLFRLLLSISA